MRILSRSEVFNAIQQSKELTEQQATSFLTGFCQEQPAIQEMLFIGFPLAIKSQNQQMSHAFMDICFEIIFTYQTTLGKLRANVVNAEWLHQTIADIENQLKAQNPVNAQGQLDIQNNAQTELLEYIRMAVEQAAATNSCQQEIAAMTYNLLFLVTLVFDRLYTELAAGVIH